jgi:hypothetical protein
MFEARIKRSREASISVGAPVIELENPFANSFSAG